MNLYVKTKKWFGETGSKWVFGGIVFSILGLAIPFIVMRISKGSGFSVNRFDILSPVGEYFGGISVGLLTFASVLLVTAAIVMQKEELALQREELEKTRHEFHTGNVTAKTQQIDTAFFNMLSLHHQIVSNINIEAKVHNEMKYYNGRQAVSQLNSIFKGKIVIQYNRENFDTGLFVDYFDDISEISQNLHDEVYSQFHEEFGNDIGHYMRNIYRIVKFLANNVVDNEVEQNKLKSETGREPIIGDLNYYFGMLRAQLSNDEFELILANSLYKENKKFKKLIIEHDILDIENRDNKIPSLRKFILKDSMKKLKVFEELLQT